MRTVAIILFDEVNALDVTGPLEALAAVTDASGAPQYQVTTWSLDGLVVRAESGIRLCADAGLPQKPQADLLIIPGGYGLRTPERLEKMALWLRRHHPQFDRIASVCTGAFALAESGLCNGRRLVTHWRFTAELQKRYPEVNLEADALFVQDGKFYSSGGITSGIDLALSIIETDFGAKAAATVARELVVFLRRTGSQSQFSEPLKFQAKTTNALHETCVWVANNLSANLSVDLLAERAGLSPRQFSRRFVQSYGRPPANYINRLRLDRGRTHLEEKGTTVDRVAYGCGFHSVDGFRKAFERQFGITPSEYQKRFEQ